MAAPISTETKETHPMIIKPYMYSLQSVSLHDTSKPHPSNHDPPCKPHSFLVLNMQPVPITPQ